MVDGQALLLTAWRRIDTPERLNHTCGEARCRLVRLHINCAGVWYALACNQRGATMYKEILLPLDGSEVSASALAPTRELAEALGARVHLLQVSSQSEDFALMRGAEFGTLGADYSQQVLDEVAAAQSDRIQRYLNEVGDELTSVGLNVVKAVEDGLAADKIVEYAEAASIDLIIMSTHGRGGVRRFFVGSVTDKVIRSTHLPVLVIHPE